MDADPGLRGFGEHDALRQGGGVDRHQVEALLVARLALVEQLLAVFAEIGAHQVDVLVGADVDAALHAGGRRDDHQFGDDVGVAGSRIALLDDVGAVGEDLEAAHHRHRRFVVAFVGDRRIVRRPVVAGALAHFFLRHEFGFTVVDGAFAVAGELLFDAGRQVDHHQVLVAHERHVAALRRDFRIADIARRDLARRFRMGRVDQVQVAGDRHQQLLAVRRPAVAQDAGQAAAAAAFAACLFFGRQGFDRHQLFRVDQPMRGLVLRVEFPQVQLELVVVAAAQERDVLAVG